MRDYQMYFLGTVAFLIAAAFNSDELMRLSLSITGILLAIACIVGKFFSQESK